MLALATLYLYWSLSEEVERDDDAFLANKIQECRRLLREGAKDTALLAHEVETEAAASQFITYFVRLLDSRGALILETPGMREAAPAPSFPTAIEAGALPSRGKVWKAGNGRSYLLMAAWAEGSERAGRYLIQVAVDVQSDEALVAGYRLKLAVVVALGMLFSCGTGVLIARKGLKPLKEIAQATERITASQLHERVVPDGWPVELASLARSFDRMLDRLEDSFKRLSQFSADLAHELRTPINNLRGEAGVALSQPRTSEEYRLTLESSLEEYARLARLIDNLLFLARADGATTEIVRLQCDARQSVEVVREYYEALADDRGVEVLCQGAGKVNVDPVLFRQAVSNLLANALNLTPHGGRVSLEVTERNGSGLEIVVSDTGPGIAAEHLPHIFERLYRADSARSQHRHGAGLGLAIVKSIMTLHGGRVEVESKLGKGTKFTLVFPDKGPERS